MLFSPHNVRKTITVQTMTNDPKISIILWFEKSFSVPRDMKPCFHVHVPINSNYKERSPVGASRFQIVLYNPNPSATTMNSYHHPGNHSVPELMRSMQWRCRMFTLWRNSITTPLVTKFVFAFLSGFISRLFMESYWLLKLSAAASTLDKWANIVYKRKNVNVLHHFDRIRI